MTGILAEVGRKTGLGPEISGKIAFGLQSAYGTLTGEKPTKFVVPARQMADLSDDIWLSPGSAALITALFQSRFRLPRFPGRRG